MELTNGRGADASMEVVGAKPTVNTCFQVVKRGGSVTLVGNLAPTVDLPLQTVVTRELSVYGSCASNGEIPQCIELLDSISRKSFPFCSSTYYPLSQLLVFPTLLHQAIAVLFSVRH